jgi:hypothetical protein
VLFRKTLLRERKKTTDWEKVFVSHLLLKELVYRVRKELSQCTSRQAVQYTMGRELGQVTKAI